MKTFTVSNREHNHLIKLLRKENSDLKQQIYEVKSLLWKDEKEMKRPFEEIEGYGLLQSNIAHYQKIIHQAEVGISDNERLLEKLTND